MELKYLLGGVVVGALVGLFLHRQTTSTGGQ